MKCMVKLLSVFAPLLVLIVVTVCTQCLNTSLPRPEHQPHSAQLWAAECGDRQWPSSASLYLRNCQTKRRSPSREHETIGFFCARLYKFRTVYSVLGQFFVEMHTHTNIELLVHSTHSVKHFACIIH